MENIWTIAIFGVIFFAIFGIVCGIGLAYAAQRYAVKTDPKIEAVRAYLPGANCGACGYAGCDSYAEAVVTDPDCPPNKCVPGKQDVADKIAAITGKIAGTSSALVAVLRCSRSEGQVKKKHIYVGLNTCQAASMTFGGPYECDFACVGYGDCEAACPFGAIRTENAMPIIDSKACTGCGICVKVCPRQVLQLLPKAAIAYVPCSSKDSGKAVTNVCKVGCIHCGACIRKAKDAVNMINDRIELDYEKLNEDMAKDCVWSCNRQFIFRYVDPKRQAEAVREIEVEQETRKSLSQRSGK